MFIPILSMISALSCSYSSGSFTQQGVRFSYGNDFAVGLNQEYIDDFSLIVSYEGRTYTLLTCSYRQSYDSNEDFNYEYSITYSSTELFNFSVEFHIGLEELSGSDVYFTENFNYLELQNGSILNKTLIDFTGSNFPTEDTAVTFWFYVYWYSEETFNMYVASQDYYQKAYEEGYNQGYQYGYDTGLNDADYQSAFDDGYDSGYAQGVADTEAEGTASYTFMGLVTALADTPIVMLHGMFDFEIFGMNILSIVLSMLTALLVLFIVKKIVK